MTEVKQEKTQSDALTGRLSGVIYEKIVELIANNTFPVNSRLPSELDLCQRFDASRPVVREALQRLREDALIVSRQGSGSYVKRRPEGDILQLVPVGSLADVQRCFEFRAGLESAAAALAAKQRNAEGMERILEAMHAFDKSIEEGLLGAEEDFNFHNAIAFATRNQYHISVQAQLRSHVVAGMNVTRSLSMRRTGEQNRIVQAEHDRIVEAIRVQDPIEAYQAMEAHIVNARKRMFEGI